MSNDGVLKKMEQIQRIYLESKSVKFSRIYNDVRVLGEFEILRTYGRQEGQRRPSRNHRK